jgi:hypothetical protein
MAILRILYKSENSDKEAKKQNKKIADLCKNTIKEVGEVEIWSKKSNKKIGCIKNKETILPFWGSIDIEADDYLPDYELTDNGLIQEIVYGKSFNAKNEEIDVIDKVIV